MSKPCFFRIAQLFDLAVCFIGGICRDHPRRKFVGYPKISAEHLALYLGRKIDSLANLFRIHASFVRGRFYISTSAFFGFMISREAPGVKPAFPVISSDEYFFVFLLDNFTLMC